LKEQVTPHRKGKAASSCDVAEERMENRKESYIANSVENTVIIEIVFTEI